jgi:hypothetical protein
VRDGRVANVLVVRVSYVHSTFSSPASRADRMTVFEEGGSSEKQGRTEAVGSIAVDVSGGACCCRKTECTCAVLSGELLSHHGRCGQEERATGRRGQR